MSNFNKALSPFKRLPDLEVDCGNGFSVVVRQTAIFNQEYRALSIKWLRSYERKNNSGKKLKRVSVADNMGVQSLTGTNDRDADISYFIDVLLVDWSGLCDDNKKPIPFSSKNAYELFTDSEEGWILIQLLVQQSTNDANFAVNEQATDAPKIAKEL